MSVRTPETARRRRPCGGNMKSAATRTRCAPWVLVTPLLGLGCGGAAISPTDGGPSHDASLFSDAGRHDAPPDAVRPDSPVVHDGATDAPRDSTTADALSDATGDSPSESGS